MHLFIASGLLCAGVFLLYPFFKNYVDPDGVAYLTIARRYASGDFRNAINGYWSPWSCWLTALLSHGGLAVSAAAVVVNAAAGVFWLIIFNEYAKMFKINELILKTLIYALAVFLWFAIFWQSFDDLWECVFLLWSLRLMLRSDYPESPKLWILNGVVGALAYFAKAYSFPFFIANTFICMYLASENGSKKWIFSYVATISVFFTLAFPWILLLREKYGFWTYSTAGSLNMSWYLVGHPEWMEGIRHLIPPVSADSPTYWEDPYMANGPTPHFWNSPHLFLVQIMRLGLNFVKLIQSISALSVVFFVIPAGGFLLKFRRAERLQITKPERLLFVSVLLFTMGYALINYESRYLWYLLIPGIILVAKKAEQPVWIGFISIRVTAVLLAVSVIAYPVYGLLKMKGVGDREQQYAEKLKSAGFKGTTFTSNRHPRSMGRLALFSGSQYFYNIDLTVKYQPQSGSDQKQQFDSVMADAGRLGVQYFYQFTGDAGNAYQIAIKPGADTLNCGETRLIKAFTADGLTVWQIRPLLR